MHGHGAPKSHQYFIQRSLLEHPTGRLGRFDKQTDPFLVADVEMFADKKDISTSMSHVRFAWRW